MPQLRKILTNVVETAIEVRIAITRMLATTPSLLNQDVFILWLHIEVLKSIHPWKKSKITMEHDLQLPVDVSAL